MYIFILTSLLDLLSKHDYFHIHMDFVILCGSTEWKISDNDEWCMWTIEWYLHGLCALLEYYAVHGGNSLPTFWDNLWGPSSRVEKSKSGCPEMSVRNFYCALCCILEECRWYLLWCRSLKSHNTYGVYKWTRLTVAVLEVSVNLLLYLYNFQVRHPHCVDKY